jgi:hypothetical protein
VEAREGAGQYDAEQRSGYSTATRRAVQEPIECPATIARSMPSASMTAITSAAIWSAS